MVSKRKSSQLYECLLPKEEQTIAQRLNKEQQVGLSVICEW